MLTMDLSQPVNIEFEQRPDFYSDLNPTTPSEEYENDMDGMLTFTRTAYDQATVVSHDHTQNDRRGDKSGWVLLEPRRGHRRPSIRRHHLSAHADWRCWVSRLMLFACRPKTRLRKRS